MISGSNPFSFLFLLCLLGLCQCLYVVELSGQIITENPKGEKIVIYADGSWRYYEPSDSIILRNAQHAPEGTQMDPGNINKPGIELPADWSQTNLNSYRRILMLREFIDSNREKYELENDRARSSNLRGNQTTSDETSTIQNDYSAFVEGYERCIQLMSNYYVVIRLSDHRALEIYDLLESEWIELSEQYQFEESVNSHSSGLPAPETIRASNYDCSYYLNDDMQTLFSYTPKSLREFIDEELDFIRCSAKIEAENSAIILRLNYTIASQDGAKSLGAIYGGAPLLLHSLKGDTIQCLNASPSPGEVMNDGTTVYRTAYLLTDQQIQLMLNHDIVGVTMYWEKQI